MTTTHTTCVGSPRPHGTRSTPPSRAPSSSHADCRRKESTRRQDAVRKSSRAGSRTWALDGGRWSCRRNGLSARASRSSLRRRVRRAPSRSLLRPTSPDCSMSSSSSLTAESSVTGAAGAAASVPTPAPPATSRRADADRAAAKDSRPRSHRARAGHRRPGSTRPSRRREPWSTGSTGLRRPGRSPAGCRWRCPRCCRCLRCCSRGGPVGCRAGGAAPAGVVLERARRCRAEAGLRHRGTARARAVAARAARIMAGARITPRTGPSTRPTGASGTTVATRGVATTSGRGVLRPTWAPLHGNGTRLIQGQGQQAEVERARTGPPRPAGRPPAAARSPRRARRRRRHRRRARR